MTAKVRREDMPAHAQRRNHRKKYLPAPPQSMQQHKRRPMSRPFGIVQLNAQLNAQANFAAIKGVLDQAWMIFAHNVFAHTAHRLAAPACREYRFFSLPVHSGLWLVKPASPANPPGVETSKNRPRFS